MKKLFNRETVSYLIFGVLTTVINYVVFGLILHFFGTGSTLIANIIAFIFAVTFAFITNKVYVFKSRIWSAGVLKKEILSFLGARLFSLGIEELGLWICLLAGVDKLELLSVNGMMIAKLVLSVIVVILNYIFSKFFIFKNKE